MTATITLADATYTDPFRAGTDQNAYLPGTWLVTVDYGDGDRFVTIATATVRAAFGITK